MIDATHLMETTINFNKLPDGRFIYQKLSSKIGPLLSSFCLFPAAAKLTDYINPTKWSAESQFKKFT